MPWNDRLRPAAYTSPGGSRFTFDFEDVSVAVDKKTTAFDFPDAAGTYVQDLGHTGRRYPLRVFFWGDDYDIEAADFEAGLLEVGVGKLEHPVFGVVDVIPFGTITRRDGLKTASNQTAIDVTFWETIGVVYPTASADPASEILQGVGAFNAASAQAFEDGSELTSAADRAVFRYPFVGSVDRVYSGLVASTEGNPGVKKEFDAIYKSITASAGPLLEDPSTLAAQINALVQSPAGAVGDVAGSLSAYYGVIQTFISTAFSQPINREKNQFQSANLIATSLVIGSAVSVVNNEFRTKRGAIEAAESLFEQFDAVVAWRDQNFPAVEEIDTGETYVELQKAVALTAGFLVDLSFSLLQERTITLTRDRSIVDLCAELYGNVDDKLDFLISSNEFTGSEIIEVPAGRTVVYYV